MSALLLVSVPVVLAYFAGRAAGRSAQMQDEIDYLDGLSA